MCGTLEATAGSSSVLPPAEIALHPGDRPAHELSLMCNDLSATMVELSARDLEFKGTSPTKGGGW
jgi:hypothetical protein